MDSYGHFLFGVSTFALLCPHLQSRQSPAYHFGLLSLAVNFLISVVVIGFQSLRKMRLFFISCYQLSTRE